MHSQSKAQCNCDFTVPLTQEIFDGTANNVQPGDTICVQGGGIRDRLHFTNIFGSPGEPVVIINCGGQVVIHGTGTGASNVPLALNGNRYFHVTGTGDPAYDFGFKIGGEAHASVEGQGKATNFELDHIEVFSSGFAGFMLKTDPDGTGYTVRPNAPDAIDGGFTMYDIQVHDCYMHDILPDGEGIYMGNSFWSTGHPTTGQYPHNIFGAKIYNNLIERTGREAIQAGCVVEGLEIYNNVIRDYGYQNNADAQNNGIQVGEGSTGRVYNNYLYNGPNGGSRGIYLLGLGDTYVYNNIIVGAEIYAINANFHPSPLLDDPGHQGYVGGAYLMNNTVIDTKGAAAFGTYLNDAPDNLLYNNLVVTQRSVWDAISGGSWMKSNNLAFGSIDSAGMADQYEAFRLAPSSPAVDEALDVSAYGVLSDFNGMSRAYNSTTDIGAVEYDPAIDSFPILESIGDLCVYEGQTAEFVIRAKDPSPSLSFKVTGLPDFATFSDNADGTASLVIHPAVGTEADYTGMKMTLSDGPYQDSEIFTISVIDPINDPPALIPVSRLLMEETDTLKVTIQATDPDSGDLVELSMANLPAFAMFTDHGNNTGELLLTPQAGDVGKYEVLEVVADDGELQTSMYLSLEVQLQGRHAAPIYRINAGGALESAPVLDWALDKQATPSDYFGDNCVNYTTGSNKWTGVNNTLAPNNVFGPYRYDNGASFKERQQWDFPVSNGHYEVRLYFKSIASEAGTNIFDVELEDSLILDQMDIYARAGKDNPWQEWFEVEVTDGNIDLNFPRITTGRSLIYGIEIVPLIPPLEVALFSTSPIVCFGQDQGSIQAVVTGGVPPYTFSWSNGASTAAISDLQAGSYTLTVADSRQIIHSAGIELTQPDSLYVETEVESAEATCAFSETHIILGYQGPESAVLHAQASGGTGDSYQYAWVPAQGLSNAGSPDPVFTPDCLTEAVHTYSFEVTVTDSVGCVASQVLYVNAVNVAGRNPGKTQICHNGQTLEVSINAVQAHLDHGDCLGSCESCPEARSAMVDTRVAVIQNVSCYPNPVQNEPLKISIEGEWTQAYLTIVNLQGKIIASRQLNREESTVNLDELSKGLYVFSLEVNGQVFYQKIQVN